MNTLFLNLMNLVDTNDAFFFKDFERDGHIYRIFNYRLASYTDFLEPGAIECRGIMFEIVNDKPLRIASRPMEKFFNKDENPLTMDLNYDNMKQVMLKADGSLISTYMNGSRLCVKSKGALESEQAVAAEEFIYRTENEKFLEALKCITVREGTVNMEWCAPDNRIVIGYVEPQLIVLNVRRNKTGEYYDYEYVKERWAAVADRWVTLFDAPTLGVDFVEQIQHETDKEGYVLLLENDMHIKVKTEWYVVQHRAKDSINSPRRLFEAVLEEATDDLRTLFHDDDLVIKMIEEMELKVEHIYNPLVKKVEDFYEENKELDRKSYAIKGQSEFTKKGEFGLVMNTYIGKDVDIKAFLKKHYKSYGIKDEEVVEDE